MCRSQLRPIFTTACGWGWDAGSCPCWPGLLAQPVRSCWWAAVPCQPEHHLQPSWLRSVSRARCSSGKERGKAHERGLSAAGAPPAAPEVPVLTQAALTPLSPGCSPQHLRSAGARRTRPQVSFECSLECSLPFEGVSGGVSQLASSQPDADCGIFQTFAAFLCCHCCRSSCGFLGVAVLAVSDREVLLPLTFEDCWGTLKRERKSCSANSVAFRTFHVQVPPAAAAPGSSHRAHL